MEPEYNSEEVQEALEAQIQNRSRVSVWVALFPDTIVMMSERAGGAKLEFAQTIGDKMEISARGFDDDGEPRRVVLLVEGRKGEKYTWNLTSPYPAALLVFERKTKGFMEAIRLQTERDAQDYREMFANVAGSGLDD